MSGRIPSQTRMPTVLCGFGSVAAGLSKDKRMAKYFKYRSHADVLRDHPAFDWKAVIDPDPDARRIAREDWNVSIAVAHPDELPNEFTPEVAVLATPPVAREELLRSMPSVKAVVVEKPLGRTLKESHSFAKYCEEKGIVCQVNLFRRAERTYQELLDGIIEEHIGIAQAGTLIYGKGILNNGIHMIDLVRMLFGEIISVQTLGLGKNIELSCYVDIEVVVALTLDGGAVITMHPVDFSHYRDVLLDVWGTRGRLEILQEGLVLRRSPLTKHRALEGVMELAIDKPVTLTSYIGTSLYQVYDNLENAMQNSKQLLSSLENAIRSEMVVEAVKTSNRMGGSVVSLASIEKLS